VTPATCAFAQGGATDRALAQQLFKDARALMASGRAAEACPNFAESDRLDPEIGTHLNLALCHEAIGKTASAWVEFGEVADRADAQHDAERANFARQHAQDLDKKLSRVRLRVEGAGPKLGVSIDGVAIGPSGWAAPLPLDPGTHTLRADAPGKSPLSQSFEVPTGPSTIDMTLAALEDAPAAPAAVPAMPASATPAPPPGEPGAVHDESHGARTLGIVLGAVGVVGIGIGSYFGIDTFSKNSTANADCPGDRCSPTGVDAGRSAQTSATISTIAFGAGIASLGAGAYFFFFSGPRDAKRGALRAAPLLGSSTAGVQLVGGW
jgi:hypothetical protein